MDTGGLLTQGVKRPGCEADHSPPSSAEVKNGGAIPPLPHMSSWDNVKLIKQRDNFIFLPYDKQIIKLHANEMLNILLLLYFAPYLYVSHALRYPQNWPAYPRNCSVTPRKSTTIDTSRN
jgi:hypothetical protein